MKFPPPPCAVLLVVPNILVSIVHYSNQQTRLLEHDNIVIGYISHWPPIKSHWPQNKNPMTTYKIPMTTYKIPLKMPRSYGNSPCHRVYPTCRCRLTSSTASTPRSCAVRKQRRRRAMRSTRAAWFGPWKWSLVEVDGDFMGFYVVLM